MSDKDERVWIAQKLASGTASQPERDKGLAMMLLDHWDRAELDEHIEKAIQKHAEGCPYCAGGGAWWHKAVITAIYVFGILAAAVLLALLSAPDRAAIVGKVVGQ